MPAGERRARTPHVRNETHPDPAGRFAVPGRYRLLVRLALACPAQHRRHRGIARRIRRHLCLDADHLRPGHPHRQDSAAYSGRKEKAMNRAENIDRFLRLNEVLHTTGLGRNTVYRRIREGTFPKQVRIGPNSVAWRQSAIAEWMTSITPSNDQSVH